MTFGDKLGEVLEEREISQKDFAESLNIAPSTLNGYIKNKRQPDFDTIKKIAELLNISIDFLMDNNTNGANVSLQEVELIKKFRQLEKSERALVCSLINMLLKK